MDADLRTHLSSINKHHVWKMQFWCKTVGAVSDPRFDVLQETLMKFLKLRNAPVGRSVQQKRHLKVAWANGDLQFIKLRNILNSPLVKEALPPGAEDCSDNMVICNVLNRPNGCLFLNYARTAQTLPSSLFSSETCTCASLFPSAHRAPSGCVRSGDLSCFRNPILKNRLLMGPKFRERSSIDSVSSLEEGLVSFSSWVAREVGIDAHLFHRWRSVILSIVRSKINRNAAGASLLGGLNDPSAKRELRFAQKHLVFVPADKASNNTVIWCKREFVKVLTEELNSSKGTYLSYVGRTQENSEEPLSNALRLPPPPQPSSPHDLLVTEVLESHRAFLTPLCLWRNDHSKLPYLYPMPKLHKQEVSNRFIAGGVDVSTTLASKMLVGMLNLVQTTLRKKDDLAISASGIRRFFIVESYDEVASFLHSWKRTSSHRSIRASDFATMFSTLPHKDLCTRMEKVVIEAAMFHDQEKDSSDLGISCFLEKGIWSFSWARQRHGIHSSSSHFFPIASIVALIRFIVNNSFVVNGDHIKIQAIGIPMGTNCAPLLANLYLYSFEAEFIDRLVKDGKLKMARLFHLTFRYIDDGLSIDNPLGSLFLVPQEDGGVYPAAILPNDTSLVDYANFLGMRIANDPFGNFSFSIYDKKADFPFKVCNYPFLESNIPLSICYNVFTGQLHRFNIICLHREFLRSSVDLAKTLCARGYSPNRLCRMFRLFVSSKHHFGIKASVLCRSFKEALRL